LNERLFGFIFDKTRKKFGDKDESESDDDDSHDDKFSDDDYDDDNNGDDDDDDVDTAGLRDGWLPAILYDLEQFVLGVYV
jgi:hypothetical protein